MNSVLSLALSFVAGGDSLPLHASTTTLLAKEVIRLSDSGECMNRDQWRAAKDKAWMELRCWGVVAAAASEYVGAYAQQQLHEAAMEYARIVRAEPPKEG